MSVLPISRLIPLTGLSLCLFLVACRNGDIKPAIPESINPESESMITGQSGEVELAPWEIEFRQQRLIGDLLYDALNALNQDRLLTPLDNNAHARYQRVLAYEPDNKLALEGLQNIVNRYIELASQASRQGRFTASQSFIERARFVNADDPGITVAQRALEQEMNSGDLVFELSLSSLQERSEELRRQLYEIAEQAKDNEAFLWITAPTDEQARWVYGVMREAVEGYRLRGNIELGSYAIVRLRLPENSDVSASN